METVAVVIRMADMEHLKPVTLHAKTIKIKYVAEFRQIQFIQLSAL